MSTFSETLCGVNCREPDLLPQAQALALELDLPLLQVDPRTIDSPAFLLDCTPEGLQLQATGRKAPGPIAVDFTHGAANHRRQFGGGKGQMIAKAVGIKSGYRPTVLDATAGLGGDAFVLATLGCSMTLIERSPLVFALLQDGLQRAAVYARTADAELADIVARMRLLAGNSQSLMATMAAAEPAIKAETTPYDVVYLDPMFPERSKSASVKKEMAAFHALVGGDDDADGLLALALSVAQYRVVVKRPVKAPPLAGQKPSLELTGKSCRYDIYTLKKMP